MGYILSESEGVGEKVHAESRRESFVLYSDFGSDRIELEWIYLEDMKMAVDALVAHRQKERIK